MLYLALYIYRYYYILSLLKGLKHYSVQQPFWVWHFSYTITMARCYIQSIRFCLTSSTMSSFAVTPSLHHNHTGPRRAVYCLVFLPISPIPPIWVFFGSFTYSSIWNKWFKIYIIYVNILDIQFKFFRCKRFYSTLHFKIRCFPLAYNSYISISDFTIWIT